ncbi:MAG: 2-hydroxyacyl-CoA dehydratase [Candidatus Bathyarchaeota archaeon]|nr:MAG: 2-hydroxyacyl-CoA dehydratase [Candidatus Bathyarchaeota archaeon]
MNILTAFKDSLLTRHNMAEKWSSGGKPVVGWSCTYTPEEIIYAADALPVMVFGNPESAKLADAYIPTNTCSFLRSNFNSALKGNYNYLDGFVASSSCDNRDKIFDMWRYYLKLPYFHFINTPHSKTRKAHKFFYEEILRFKTSLEETLGKRISASALKNAIQVYNENRSLLKRVYNLRRNDPPLISGAEALEIVLSSMIMEKKAHNKMLKKLLVEAPHRIDPPKDAVRVLISGSIMDNIDPFKIVESVGGNIVADDLCTGSAYFWDMVGSDTNPIRAITRRYLNKIPSAFMLEQKERFRHTIKMAKQFNVEAAIILVLKFCDAHMFDAPQLANELKEEGLPVLYLEWEHSLSGRAQLKTRIEAFMEMVGEVK